MIIILAVIGGGYWYWTGPYQESKLSPLELRLVENAKTMKRCMGKEKSMTGAAGMGGVGGMGASDPEAFCARENNLVLKGGEWHDVRDGGY